MALVKIKDDVAEIKDKDIHKILVSGRSYFDILLYNCYEKKDTNEDGVYGLLDKNKLNQAFDDLISNYSELLNVGILLSGFQFVGIILEKNLALTESQQMSIAYFMLSTGFLVSMFGVVICFITNEYLRGCRAEEPEFIIAGIQKYKWIFKSADLILYSNSIMFIIPINLLIYNTLSFTLGLIYNIICGSLLLLGLSIHYMIIVSKQKYILTEDDLNNNHNIGNVCNTLYSLLCSNEEGTYQRKIYKIQNESQNESQN